MTNSTQPFHSITNPISHFVTYVIRRLKVTPYLLQKKNTLNQRLYFIGYPRSTAEIERQLEFIGELIMRSRREQVWGREKVLMQIGYDLLFESLQAKKAEKSEKIES